MIYKYMINGLPIKTGDILCTSDGAPTSWFGRLWQLIGYLVPGHIDHIIIYIGPGNRFVEAGARGVIEFEMPNNRWDAAQMVDLRLLMDTLVGVAYPLRGLNLSVKKEEQIRTTVATYCLDRIGKPYNANFLKVVTNEAFYCSQLAYLAYRKAGIDIGMRPVRLFAGEGDTDEHAPLIVLPTTILDNCEHRLVSRRFWLHKRVIDRTKRADSPVL